MAASSCGGGGGGGDSDGAVTAAEPEYTHRDTSIIQPSQYFDSELPRRAGHAGDASVWYVNMHVAK